MKLVAIKKHSSKLKNMRVEMPNATYSNHWQQKLNDGTNFKI